MLQPERQDGFLDLARQRALLGQEQVLGELLGQGRATLRPAAARDVAGQRAGDAQGIDAVVGVEAAILDGHEGLRQVGGQIGQADRRPAGVAAVGQQRPVRPQDGNVGRTLGYREPVDGGQLAGVVADQNRGADPAPDGGHQRPGYDPGHHRSGPPPRRGRVAPAGIAGAAPSLAHGRIGTPRLGDEPLTRDRVEVAAPGRAGPDVEARFAPARSIAVRPTRPAVPHRANPSAPGIGPEARSGALRAGKPRREPRGAMTVVQRCRRVRVPVRSRSKLQAESDQPRAGSDRP